MKYNLLTIYGFNDYFNRKIIFYDSLVTYLNLPNDKNYLEDVNFNPADGVDTELILNLEDVDTRGKPNYLLVIDKDSADILERYFIKDADRTTGGQYKLILRRDVIADSYSALQFAPIFGQ